MQSQDCKIQVNIIAHILKKHDLKAIHSKICAIWFWWFWRLCRYFVGCVCWSGRCYVAIVIVFFNSSRFAVAWSSTTNTTTRTIIMVRKGISQDLHHAEDCVDRLVWSLVVALLCSMLPSSSSVFDLIAGAKKWVSRGASKQARQAGLISMVLSCAKTFSRLP